MHPTGFSLILAAIVRPAARGQCSGLAMRLLRVALLSVIAIASSVLAAPPELPQWAVFTAGEATAFTRPCSRPFPTGLSEPWTPEAADIARAERRFDAAVKAAFEHVPSEYRDPRPPQYYRQYAGFLRNGKRVLYVNAVAEYVITRWDLPDRSWRRNAVLICDGGTLTFGAVFDLEKNDFDSLEFNGTVGGPIPKAND